MFETLVRKRLSFIFRVCAAMGVVCCSSGTVSAAQQLSEAWRSGRSSVSVECLGDGAYGRLVYLRPGAQTAAEPPRLVDARRRVCFVADGASWARSIGLGASEILLRNGVERSWIEGEAARGTRFKLAIFDGDEDSVWPADWPGVRRAVEKHYAGAVAIKLRTHWPALETSSWEALEEEVGEKFAELDRQEGPMTAERYAEALDSSAHARRFLASDLSLNRLFAGTGFTVDERKEGGRGTAEFFTANRTLSSIPPAQLIDVDL